MLYVLHTTTDSVLFRDHSSLDDSLGAIEVTHTIRLNRRWGRARGKKLLKGIVISTQRAIPRKMIPVPQFFFFLCDLVA